MVLWLAVVEEFLSVAAGHNQRPNRNLVRVPAFQQVAQIQRAVLIFVGAGVLMSLGIIASPISYAAVVSRVLTWR